MAKRGRPPKKVEPANKNWLEKHKDLLVSAALVLVLCVIIGIYIKHRITDDTGDIVIPDTVETEVEKPEKTEEEEKEEIGGDVDLILP